MSKSIKTLIKLCDEELKALTRNYQLLLDHLENLQAVINQADLEMEQEKQFLQNNSEVGNFFSSYLSNYLSKKELLLMEVQKLQKQQKILDQKIQDQFAQLKAYQLTEERHRLKELKLEQKKEAEDMDELNVSRGVK